MNRNVTPVLLLIIAIGIYFTFTKSKFDEVKAVKAVNADYEQALENAEKLIKVRDQVLKTYNTIDQKDKDRLEKLIPDNIDNVRLIIDIKGIGQQHGLVLRNLKTSASNSVTPGKAGVAVPTSDSNIYNTMTISFDVTTTYQGFIDLLKSLESSLRILDISRISVTSNDTGLYEYKVELKTYWLKQ